VNWTGQLLILFKANTIYLWFDFTPLVDDNTIISHQDLCKLQTKYMIYIQQL